jgi:hypothetical protein
MSSEPTPENANPLSPSSTVKSDTPASPAAVPVAASPDFSDDFSPDFAGADAQKKIGAISSASTGQAPAKGAPDFSSADFSSDFATSNPPKV